MFYDICLAVLVGCGTVITLCATIAFIYTGYEIMRGR